ncbi:helix-turn-helix domain-containing protein [Actinoplanes sp. CA-030573]|uniref:helix-turn-helix domain-containing protein n=1 Tax=Actinoplanes sp. CA-030573 TaxID=3239898 RepID=UPI003D94D8D1
MGIALGDDALRRLLGPSPTIADVLAVAAEAVPCDIVSWSRLDLAGRRVLDNVCSVPVDDDDLDEAFWATYREHPLCHGPGSLLPVCAISDLLSPREWHRTAIYAEYFQPTGVEHELGVNLSHPAGQTNVLLFDRGPGADFDGHDRLVLTLLRPHLDAAIQRIVSPALTPREEEVLGLVRHGLTNRAISRRLGISPHTVRKHLENAYARLDVHTRTEAAFHGDRAIDGRHLLASRAMDPADRFRR